MSNQSTATQDSFNINKLPEKVLHQCCILSSHPDFHLEKAMCHY